MQNLADAINEKDVFMQPEVVDEAVIQEYYERNERKKEDDKWLKAYKPVVAKALADLNKDKADFGEFRASSTVPDNSKFDEDKLIGYIALHHPDVYEEVTELKAVLNEEKLELAVEEGLLDIEKLKSVAWIEKKGTPRINVKKVIR